MCGGVPEGQVLGVVVMVFNDWGGRGEKSRTSKLTDSQVYEVRARWDAGERKFGASYGVSDELIYSIGSRRAWTHLPEKKPE